MSSVLTLGSVSGCPDAGTLGRDFSRMRNEFGARYVRMYGGCDWDDSFFDRFVSTAYSTGLGVYATVWMDFDGSDSWRGRRDKILNVIQNNPYSPYTVRSVDLGSEALFFHVSRSTLMLIIAYTLLALGFWFYG
jgi:hypothetical protein